MDSFGVILITVFLPLAFLVAIGYAIFVAYRYFTKKRQDTVGQDSELTLHYLPHFGLFLSLLLIGFNIGLYNTLFTGRVPALGLAIFQTALAIGWLVLYWNKRNWLIYILTSVMAVSGWFLFWRANGFVQSINIAMFFITQTLLFVFLIRQYISSSLLSYVQTVLLSIPAGVRQFFVVIKDTLSSGKGRKYSVLSWIKTLGITLIVVIFFISILSAGDPLFAEIIKDIREQLVGRVLWSILLIFISSVFLTMHLPKYVAHR